MKSALSNEINYYMRRAMQINKRIGGKTAYQSMERHKDKLIVVKEDIMAGFHYIKEKLKEKEKKKVGAEHIRIDNEVRDKLATIEQQLQDMNSTLKKTKNPSEKNMQMYEFLRSQWVNYKELMEDGGSDTTSRGLRPDVATLTDLRAGLLEQAPTNQKKKGAKRVRKEQQAATEFELEAMDRWKKNDEKIDQQVDKLIDKTHLWKNKAIQMGDAIDQTSKQIETLTTKVDDVNKSLVTANKDLKDIVEKFRKPHRCCLDVFLFLILMGLIIGIIHYAKK